MHPFNACKTKKHFTMFDIWVGARAGARAGAIAALAPHRIPAQAQFRLRTSRNSDIFSKLINNI
jgi:hypothetical protein